MDAHVNEEETEKDEKRKEEIKKITHDTYMKGMRAGIRMLSASINGMIKDYESSGKSADDIVNKMKQFIADSAVSADKKEN